MMFLIILIFLVIITLILTFMYFISIYNENYWRKRGVPFYTKNKVFGPIGEFLTSKRAFFEIMSDIYKQYQDAPAVGLGNFLIPALYVKDPENVQHMFQAGFQEFNHRDLDFIDDDLLADNLLFMHGNRWKVMRQNISPLFTLAKLKNMYYVVDKSAQDFVEFLKNNPEKLKGDTLDTMAHYCCAAMSAAVFGFQNRSTFESPFLDMSRRAFKTSWKAIVKFVLSNISSSMVKTCRIKFFVEFQNFFIKAIKQVLRQREMGNVKKHDFVDLCLSIQKKGVMIDDKTGFELDPTDEILAAQGFFFFTAGVEPTAMSIYAMLLELGRHKEILERLQDEIDETFKICEGQVTYDVLNKMEYLDKVYNETLRMHPPVGGLTRRCIEDTVLPVGNIAVQKGTKIFTPIYEYHHDPKYFPNPEVFDPERFAKGLKPNDKIYMPFGRGNRICIGAKYSEMQAKTGLLYILRHYTVKTNVNEGGIKYNKHNVFVRIHNVDIELIERGTSKY